VRWSAATGRAFRYGLLTGHEIRSGRVSVPGARLRADQENTLEENTMLTTDYLPGSPLWVDLGSPDTDRTVAFYNRVLGWSFQSAGPGAGGYGFFQIDGQTVAAVGPLMEEGADSRWTVYFHTPDADTTAKTVEQVGGEVRVPPMDVFDRGRMAQFADSRGARFAVWQPGSTKGLDTVSEDGALVWAELHTDGAAASKSFYRQVFGWDAEDNEMPGGMTYTVLSTSGGGQERSFGGVFESSEELRAAGVGPHWLPYFAVADTDAVVAAALGTGGRVLMPATSMEGVGRMASLADPFGASFSVLKPEPPTAA
jgi:uncharacterized protein